MAIPRRTQLDREQEKRRREMLEQTLKDLQAHFASIMRDNYQRVLDISDEEWQAATDAEGGEGAA